MKTLSLATFGMLLAVSPAFAQTALTDAALVQANSNQSIGNAYSGKSSVDNAGVSNSLINNASGVTTQNLNAGASANVGSLTAVTASSPTSNSAPLSLTAADLVQVNSGNQLGASVYGATSAYSAGVTNSTINGANGIVTQNVNSGIGSNVGSLTVVSVK